MALNKCVLQGNLCKDVELLQTSNGGTCLRNTIASQRNYVKEGENRQSDFVSILAYGKTAEHIQKFFNKGSQILVEGRIQTGSYDKEDGTKVYTTDLIVEQVYFCGSSKQTNTNNEIPEEFRTAESTNVNNQNSDVLPF